MYGGFWLQEAHSVLFYEVLGFCGDTITNGLKRPGGSAKEDPHVRGGRGGGGAAGELDFVNVSRALAPGATFCRVL